MNRGFVCPAAWVLAALAAAGCGTDRGAGGAATGGTGGGADALLPAEPSTTARIFVPRIVADDGSQAIWNHSQKSAIFWFGQVDSRNDSTDVRVGYGDDFLMVHAAVFDQKIYDAAQDDALDQWDSITLLLDLDGSDTKSAVDARSLRIDAQAHRQGTDRTVVYRGQGGAWVPAGIAVGTAPDTAPQGLNLVKGYRGEDADHSRGWTITFFLGWQALGLSGPPLADGTRTWRVAMVGYDRDDLAGTTGGDPQYWPSPALVATDPSSWGRWELLDGHYLSWAESGSGPGQGRPAYAIAYQPEPYAAGTETSAMIREGLDGDHVENRSVGASETLCSGDDAYNFGDGPASFGGNTTTNYFAVQNEEDVSDWPCFSKLYVKFPLTKLPVGQVLVSARLVLHHKQPTSGGTDGVRSLIQVLPVGTTLRDGVTDWTEANLTWNNAPLAFENQAGTWGDRSGLELGWDALPAWEWDVSRDVAAAAAAGQTQVAFALYSADSEYNTGKEFVSSADFPDWGDPNQRPRLDLTYAAPAAP